MRHATSLLPVFLACLVLPCAARAEAPHSTTVQPGGSNETIPSQKTTPLQTYSALEPGSETESGSAPAVEVDNQPPRFLYSASPAVLIPVDGQPVLHDSGAADLDRVINSRAPLFRSRRDSRYHLALGSQWYAARSIDGEWAAEASSSALRSRLEEARKKATAASEIDEISASAGAKVFVSSEPAELIQTTGNAALTPIGNGRLLYVTNTPNDLFYHSGDQQYYVLASGRWYRSSSLQGSWSYVGASALPAEFAQIPPGHPKAGVLVSVPGTDAAHTAVAAASVPQVATVDRTVSANGLSYDGSPEFTPIPGTALEYARNSSEPVIEVSPGRFMLVENGVWFEAPTAQGPWAVATSVPPAIYTIPPSSPVYYVSYVYVYGYGSSWVRVGYLPGYLGSYVTPDGVVVYGTGYHPYRPYWGPWRWERYHQVGYAPGPVYVARHDFYHDWAHHVTPMPYQSQTPPGRPFDSRPGWNHTPPGWSHGGWTHSPSAPTQGTPPGSTQATSGGWSHYTAPAPTRSAPPSWFTRPSVPQTAWPAPYHGPSMQASTPTPFHGASPSPFARPQPGFHSPLPRTPSPRSNPPSDTHQQSASRDFHVPSTRADFHGAYSHGSTEHARR